MEKLFAWLRVEPTGLAFWKFLIFAVAAGVAFNGYVEIITAIFGIEVPSSPELDDLARNRPLLLFSMLPIFAAIEELLFRLPLAIFAKYNASPKTFCVATVALSTLFGLAHGGWINVPIQGVAGILLCIVFLKCGGLEKKYFKAFFSSTGVHLAYNFLAFSVFFLYQ